MKNKLHKLGFYLFLGIGILGTTFTSCSSDDNGVTNIAVAKEDYQSLTGEEVTIDPKIGKAGATYTWYNHRESKTIGNQEILKHTFTEPGKYNLSLKVEDAGTLEIFTYTVTVEKNFDYNYVVTDLTKIDLGDGIPTAGGKIWKDTFTDDAELKTGIFNIKHIAINEWHTWLGFTVSNSTDSADHINSEGGWIKNQWGTMAGGAVNGAGKPFLVSYTDQKPHPSLLDPTKPVPVDRFSSVITIDDEANTYKAVSTQVAISPWPYYGILKGDAFASKFEKGDYFALHIYGVDADNMLTSDTPVTHYFVDFRNGVNEINTDWSKVDLSSLGEVKHLVFFLETTDVGDWGPNTALYFTMDQLTVDKVE